MSRLRSSGVYPGYELALLDKITFIDRQLDYQSIILSFSFAAAVGIFFGLYPARQASMLKPIDALRYE